jgi:O-antigen ligase
MLHSRRDHAGVRRWVGALVVAAIAVSPFVLADAPWVTARTDASGLIATEARSIDEREALAAEANQLFIDHPLLGVGLGGLPLAEQQANPSFGFSFQPAHIVLLDVAAETGILGGLLFLILLVAPWLALVRVRQRWTPDLAAASAALAAITVVGFFDYYTWTYPAGRIWAWLVLGVWAVAYRRARLAAEIRPVRSEPSPEAAVSA